MPKWGYSIIAEELDPEKTAKASGREIRVSHKAAREVCRTIKGAMLAKAKTYLRDVIEKKKAVPFRRYKKKLGHRRGLVKTFAGRYRQGRRTPAESDVRDIRRSADWLEKCVRRLRAEERSCVAQLSAPPAQTPRDQYDSCHAYVWFRSANRAYCRSYRVVRPHYSLDTELTSCRRTRIYHRLYWLRPFTRCSVGRRRVQLKPAGKKSSSTSPPSE